MRTHCGYCNTEYDVDLPAGGGSASFRCVSCGRLVEVAGRSVAPTPALPTEAPPVRVAEAAELLIKQDGQVYRVPDFATVQRWIVERRLLREDLVSADGITWDSLGTRAELAVFFSLVELVEGIEPPAAPPPPALPPAPREPTGDEVSVDRPITDVRGGLTSPPPPVADFDDEAEEEALPAESPSAPGEDEALVGDSDEDEPFEAAAAEEPPSEAGTELGRDTLSDTVVPERWSDAGDRPSDTGPPTAIPFDDFPAQRAGWSDLDTDYGGPTAEPPEPPAQPVQGSGRTPAPEYAPRPRPTAVWPWVVGGVVLILLSLWFVRELTVQRAAPVATPAAAQPVPAAASAPVDVAPPPPELGAVPPPPGGEVVAGPDAAEAAPLVAEIAEPAVAELEPSAEDRGPGPAPGPADAQLEPEAVPEAAPEAAPEPAVGVTAATFSAAGWKAINAGEYGQARVEFVEAVALAPQDPDAHYGLAYAADRQGDQATAVRHYCQALAFGRADVELTRDVEALVRKIGAACD